MRTPMADLDRTAWVYSSCEPNSFKHFFTDISDHDQANNLAIVVEDLEENTDPESLKVMLFQVDVGDEPPVDPSSLTIDTGNLTVKESVDEILTVYRKMATLA